MKFRPLRLLPRPLYAAAKTRGDSAMDIQTIGHRRAGQMGNGIAPVMALAGL